MRNNETGEFELVLGNRQLLSGFFIVVLLFGGGVCDGLHRGAELGAIGKACGRTPRRRSQHARPTARPQPAAPAAPARRRLRRSPPSGRRRSRSRSGRDAARQPPPTQPARDSPAATGRSARAVRPCRAAPGNLLAGDRGASRKRRRSCAQTLKDKGFPASLGPGPNNLTRVLVGPYTDTAVAGQAPKRNWKTRASSRCSKIA